MQQHISDLEKFSSDKYISAEGSGNSIQEAQDSALAQISLYFDTSVQVSRSLVAEYKEIEVNGFYRSIENRDIQEKADIKSEAQFYCVQFTPAAKSGKEYYTVAYIDRDKAYKTFRENISINTSVLESLLPIAQNSKNPFYSIPACKRGKTIADVTLTLIKNIKTISPDINEDFSESKKLTSLMRAAYQKCRDNADVSIHAIGDWNNVVRNTLSQLMEESGFTVSHSDNACSLYAEINANREKNAAGIFLTPSILVQAKTADGKTVFSYTKKFDREGAPENHEDVAWRKSFAKIESDLRESFSQKLN